MDGDVCLGVFRKLLPLFLACLCFGSPAALGSCGSNLEGGSPDDKKDWDAAFESMMASESPKLEENAQSAAALAILMARNRMGLDQPGVTPELLVRRALRKQLGADYGGDLPPDLLEGARQIIEMKLTGETTEREKYFSWKLE